MLVSISNKDKKMKKNFLSIISIVALISGLIFTSCSDPVFYYISKDVPSETATVNGIIRSIARYTIDNTEYIVTVSSNGIVYKPVAYYNDGTGNYDWDETTQSHGTWTKITESELPFAMHYYNYTEAKHHGEQILKVVADEENLYIITVSYYINDDEGTSCPETFRIYTVKPTEESRGKWNKLSNSDWSEILNSNDDIDKTAAIYESEDYTFTALNIFSTNSAQKSERKVVLRIGNGSSADSNGDKTRKYYEISGGAINSTYFTISSAEILDYDSNRDSVNSVNGIAILDGTTYYSATQSLTTNATFNTQATAMYWGNGSCLYYQTSGGEATKSIDVSYTINSLAICKDAIIIGRGQNSNSYLSSSGGIEKVQLTTDTEGNYTNIPESSRGTFETNAQTQLLSSYLIQTTFNSTPGLTELDSSLYASLYFIGSGSSTSVSYNNIGLWSYYPSRKNWNRE